MDSLVNAVLCTTHRFVFFFKSLSFLELRNYILICSVVAKSKVQRGEKNLYFVMFCIVFLLLQSLAVLLLFKVRILIQHSE